MTDPSPRFPLDTELWRTTSGSEYVQALAGGALPMPVHVSTLGYRIRSAEPGSVVFDWEPPATLRNRAGFVQGGFVVAAMDESSTYAAASSYARFVPQMTVDLRTDFLRPVAADAFTVTGEVVRKGRAFATVRAAVSDTEGRQLAILTATVIPNKQMFPAEVWPEAGL